MTRPYAEQLADYAARCDAYDDECRPQSHEQWRKLNALYRAGRYALECSHDGHVWFAPSETRISGGQASVTRSELPLIQREAEFYSHRYPHVRIVHPVSA